MIFGSRRFAFWILTLSLAVSCSAPPVAAQPDFTPTPIQIEYPSTPTPFSPQADDSPNPYLTMNSPQEALPTFTPYPTKYVAPQDFSAPIESPPDEQSAATLYNPLTGLPIDDPSFLQVRPLAIKVGNSPDYVRPQSGLTLADVVYEYYIEWGDTRFIAVFYSNLYDIERIGPVRSGRYFDEHIVRMYRSFLMFKGADKREFDYFMGLDVAERFISVGIGKCPPYYYGPYKRDAYNNIFFNATLWEDCVAKKELDNSPQTLVSGFFAEEIPQTPLKAKRIYDFYTNYSYNYWQYDEETHSYFRYQEAKDLGGSRDAEVYAQLFDDYTKQPVTADNVVVIFVPYIFTNQNQAEDEVFNPSLIDYGNAYVFRDGVVIPAYWKRVAIDQPLLLTQLDGSPIYLRPGQTFYQVMGITSAQKQNGEDWRFEFHTP
ncbi:MAG: DUF3048 domain-containing protein [Anaerolineales bacterium]|nr:DUF3048 domain-containing protein [Anaerolineales bacterium]